MSEPASEPEPFVVSVGPRVDPWKAAKRGVAIAWSHYPALLLFWLPVVVLDAVVMAFQFAVPAPPEPIAGHAMSPDDVRSLVRYAGLLLPLSFLYAVVYLVFLGASATVVVAALKPSSREGASENGARASFRTLATRALPLAGASTLALLLVFGAFLLASLVGALVSEAIGGGVSSTLGLALFIVIPASVFVASRLLFVLPAVAVDRLGVAEAFRKSRALARENRTGGFALLAILVWFSLLLLARAAVTLAATLAGAKLSDVALDFASEPVRWLVAPFVPAMVAAFYALVTRPEPSPPSVVRATPVPGRETAPAPREERFRMTKCPQCATIIPYEATGSETRVECPHCGRTGLVRS